MSRKVENVAAIEKACNLAARSRLQKCQVGQVLELRLVVRPQVSLTHDHELDPRVVTEGLRTAQQGLERV